MRWTTNAAPPHTRSAECCLNFKGMTWYKSPKLAGIVRTRGVDFSPLIVLVAGVGVLGQAGVSAARYWFLLGCPIVGYYARRSGPAVHLQTILILFCVAPFLRRLVDFSTGFEPDALMFVRAVSGAHATYFQFDVKISPTQYRSHFSLSLPARCTPRYCRFSSAASRKLQAAR